MKYDAEIDLRNLNTSHSLMVQLVGRGQRVLDVGCAVGDLGRVLKRRDCRVSGVERDPVAAHAAEAVLDDVLIGDVGDLDLVGHFGKECFDVIVFGDVLEHLADPIAVLKKVRPLLVGTGSVVASIPNVAHGAVRLSLLDGRFDYGPLGLRDATHLRFFTRGSVYETFREAGLIPVEMRQTTVGVFETELDIRREDFDPGVVDSVEGDPDSTTYQFVLRAVAEDGSMALREQPSRSTLARTVPRCRVGIWSALSPDDPVGALVLRVTHAELARRLQGSLIRSFSWRRDPQPGPHDGGLPVEPLGEWSAESVLRLAAELDCVILASPLPGPGLAPHSAGSPERFLVEGLGARSEQEFPVLWSAVRLQGGRSASPDGFAEAPVYRSVLDRDEPLSSGFAADDRTAEDPDPLLLAPRLLSPGKLGRRLEFARMMRWFPREGPAIVIEMAGALLGHADAIGHAVDAAASRSGAAVVLLQFGQGGGDGDAGRAADAVAHAMTAPVFRVPTGTAVDDVVAIIAGSVGVGACTSPAASIGRAYGHPVAHLALDAGPASGSAGPTGAIGATVTQARELVDLLEHPRFRADGVAELQARLDAHFDLVAAAADGAAADRPGPANAGATLSPAEYVAAVEKAHRRMQERLDAERLAVADHLGASRSRDAALRSELDSRLERVTAELAALNAIRILRMLRPARAIYARLRGGRL